MTLVRTRFDGSIVREELDALSAVVEALYSRDNGRVWRSARIVGPTSDIATGGCFPPKNGTMRYG